MAKMRALQYATLAIRVAAGFAILYWILSFYDWIIAVFHGTTIPPLYLTIEPCVRDSVLNC